MKAKNGAQVIVATVQSEQSESYLRPACWRVGVSHIHLLLAFHLSDKLLKI